MNGCLLCEFGWRSVDPSYVDRFFPIPDVSSLPEDLAEIALRENTARRSGAQDAVFPCQTCQPTLFFRWSGKHLEAKHDAENCPECAEIARGGSPSQTTTLARPSLPERKDTD